MSRRESDREDLLREATALVQRAELSIPGYDEPIVVGFRRDGSASFYFGADPVYQFNTAGELRRAFIGGLLYKAECGRLISLRRERSASEVALMRTTASAEASAALLTTLYSQLSRLCDALTGGGYTLIGQVPPDTEIIPRIQAWLAAMPPRIEIAHASNVR